MSIDSAIGILLSVVLALVAYLLKEDRQRIKNLEKDSVSRADFAQKIAELQSERMRLHTENRGKLDEIVQTTREINTHSVDLGRIDERLGHVEAYLDYLKQWKHLTVDPYVPRVLDDHDRRINRLEATK